MPNPPDVEHFGKCPSCGKLRYRARRTAKRAARSGAPGHHLNAYKCGDYWHIGHTPRAVIAGDITRDQLVAPRAPTPTPAEHRRRSSP